MGEYEGREDKRGCSKKHQGLCGKMWHRLKEEEWLGRGIRNERGGRKETPFPEAVEHDRQRPNDRGRPRAQPQCAIFQLDCSSNFLGKYQIKGVFINEVHTVFRNTRIVFFTCLLCAH